jgi:hypothetical protein
MILLLTNSSTKVSKQSYHKTYQSGHSDHSVKKKCHFCVRKPRLTFFFVNAHKFLQAVLADVIRGMCEWKKICVGYAGNATQRKNVWKLCVEWAQIMPLRMVKQKWSWKRDYAKNRSTLCTGTGYCTSQKLKSNTKMSVMLPNFGP